MKRKSFVMGIFVVGIIVFLLSGSAYATAYNCNYGDGNETLSETVVSGSHDLNVYDIPISDQYYIQWWIDGEWVKESDLGWGLYYGNLDFSWDGSKFTFMGLYDGTKNIYSSSVQVKAYIQNSSWVTQEIKTWNLTGALPDIICQDISVSSPRYAGQSATITATIKNQGTDDADSFNLKYYVDGTYIGEDTLSFGLDAGDNDTETYSYIVSSSGSHVVKVFVDSDYEISESDETNNNRSETFSWSDPPKPDLIIQDISISPTSPIVGENVTITATVKNQGDADASQFSLKYYVDDLYIGDDTLTFGLNAGNTNNETISYTASSKGNHIIKVFIDSNYEITESNENNNERVEEFEWDYPKGNLNVTVQNQNVQATGPSEVKLYSDDWVTLIDSRTTDSSGFVSWTNIETGDYKLEAYYNGEYWVNGSTTVNEGATTNEILKRNEPYAFDFKVYNVSTGEDVTNQTILADTPLKYEIKIRNSSPVNRTVKVNLWVDEEKSSSCELCDFCETSDPESILSGGNEKTFIFYHTPESSGTFFRRLEVETEVNSNYIKTDSWSWENVFICNENNDDAQIISFIPPTGILERGDEVSATVRVKNIGTSTRSFWVGLSFAGPGSYEWPIGWFDILPMETVTLEPNEEDLLIFTFKIWETLPEGAYLAYAAVWDDYDEEHHLMIPMDDTTIPRWDDEPSFSLEAMGGVPDNMIGLLTKAVKEIAQDYFIGENIAELYEGNPLEGRNKALLYFGAEAGGSFVVEGVPVAVNAGGKFVIDLVDLLEVDPEGKDGWVTIWVDCQGSTGIGSNTFGGVVPDFGITTFNFDYNELSLADERKNMLFAVEGELFGFAFTAITWSSDSGWERPHLGRTTDFPIKGLSLGLDADGLKPFEVNKTKIRDAILSIELDKGLDYFVESLEDAIYAIPSEAFREPATMDDGSWALENGELRTNLKCSEQGEAHHFYIDVPSDSSDLNIGAYNGTGNADIYVRAGDRPSLDEYTAKSTSYSNEDSVIISDPSPGKWYIMLHATSPYPDEGYDEGVSLFAKYENALSYPPILTVTPSSLDFGAVTVGNFKDLTFTLENTGYGILDGSVTVLSPFSIEDGEYYSLTHGQTHIVKVRFHPTISGTFESAVIFTGGGGNTKSVIGEGTNTVAVPVIQTILDQSIIEGTTYIGPTPVLVQGTGPILWTLVTNDAQGMSIDSATGIVNWTNPTATGSPFLITICATNNQGYDETTWQLSVSSNNKPIVNITSPSGDQSVPNSTTSYEFFGTATDSDGSVSNVQGRVRSGPWQAAIGTTSWNFTVNLEVGSNLVEFRAQDNNGAYGEIESRIITREYSTYTISGQINLQGGSESVKNVLLTLIGDNNQETYSNENGNYSFSGIEGNSYQLTPYLSGYYFFPDSISYSPLYNDESNQNFIGLYENYDSEPDNLPDWWEQQIIEFDLNDDIEFAGDIDPGDDYDNDNLTNLQEYNKQTDPTKSDTDGDGYWDGDEVLYGSDPTLISDTPDNHKPDKPIIQSETTDVPLRYHVFSVSEFSDPDSDSLISSEWQISTDEDFSGDGIVFQKSLVIGTGIVEEEDDVLLFTMSEPVFLPDTDYWIRVMLEDSTGLWSSWSDTVAFTTVSEDPDDLDNNGVDDSYQVVGDADTNNNGVNDSEEGIITLSDAGNDSTVGVSPEKGIISGLTALSISDLPEGVITNEKMPYGLFSFRIDGLSVGETVNVTFYFTDDIPSDAKWYKYDSAGGTLVDYTDNIVINGNAIILSITDGGSGDFDETINSIIIDPSGPAFAISGTETVSTPAFSPSPGTYTSSQSVSISCDTSDATICYSTNGDEPTEDSSIYSSPITISSTTTINAKAFKTGWNASEIATGTYTIDGDDDDDDDGDDDGGGGCFIETLVNGAAMGGRVVPVFIAVLFFYGCCYWHCFH